MVLGLAQNSKYDQTHFKRQLQVQSHSLPLVFGGLSGIAVKCLLLESSKDWRNND